MEESLIQRLDVSRMGRAPGIPHPITISALVCVNEACDDIGRGGQDVDGHGRLPSLGLRGGLFVA